MEISKKEPSPKQKLALEGTSEAPSELA